MNNVQQFTATGTKQRIYPWFNAITALDTEARASITNDGIDITIVDPANVSMLTAHISPEQFETFKTTASIENPFTLGLDFSRYSSIMKKRHIGAKSMFSFETIPPIDTPANIDEDMHTDYVHPKQLHRVLFGVDGVLFNYTTLGPTTIRNNPNVPRLDTPIDMTLPLTELCNFLHAVSTAGIDHIQFSVDFTDVDKPVFIMFGETDAGERISMTIPTSDLPHFKCTTPHNWVRTIGSLHSIDYLNPITKAFKAFSDVDNIRIQFGADYPVKLSMELEDKSSLMYMLAPRIESE